MNDIFGLHKHHIVFRSQGGLDFALNMIELTQEEHEGINGPHRNRAVDLALKTDLQRKLFILFPKEELFTIKELSEKLGRTPRYFASKFKRVPMTGDRYSGSEIVKRLMGGRYY